MSIVKFPSMKVEFFTVYELWVSTWILLLYLSNYSFDALSKSSETVTSKLKNLTENM